MREQGESLLTILAQKGAAIGKSRATDVEGEGDIGELVLRMQVQVIGQAQALLIEGRGGAGREGEELPGLGGIGGSDLGSLF